MRSGLLAGMLVVVGLVMAGCPPEPGPLPGPADGTPRATPEDAPDPGEADDVAAEPRVLVFSRTAGFRHASIPAGVAAIEGLGEVSGFAVVATEDPAVFSDDGLAGFDVVVFLSTTGDVLDEDQEAAFERFIGRGRGYVGIHAAADTEYEWPWYGGLVGAYFKGHPPVQEATVLVGDRGHPSTVDIPERWIRRDEWYDYRDNPRERDGAGADSSGRIKILATVLEDSYTGGGMGADHPIAWCQEYGGGLAWYTGGGHTVEAFAEPEFLSHIAGGIRWAAGR